MDEYGGTRLDGIASAVRRKRSQTSRRPKPESLSSLSSTPPSEDIAKVSSDENTGYDGSSKRKTFNLNQCISRSSSSRMDGETAFKKMKDGESGMLCGSGGLEGDNVTGQSQNEGVISSSKQSDVVSNGVVHETKFKKVKLKVGGITRTIQTSQATSESGTSTKSVRLSEAPQPLQKQSLQDDLDDNNFSTSGRKSGLRGIPWKDFSRVGFTIKKEERSTGKMPEKTFYSKQGEKSEPHKSKRETKKRDLSGVYDDDDVEDDEIRYLEKLKTSRVSGGLKDAGKESGIKHRSLSRVSKGVRYDSLKDFGPSKSGRELEGRKKKIPRRESPDSPTEGKREFALTTRQRARLSVKDPSSMSASSSIEFPNGLPPPPPRKQKEKLTEVEQQLKKAEAAERRRMHNEKAARESEAEAIRKILGQDSSRKKREDKIKKRQEELAQERAANAQTLPPNTVRCVIGPTGTRVIFSEDIGLPCIFDPKPCSYPPPREKCAGPSCDKPYKYRDSKSRVPLCSLQCYKAVHDNLQAGTTC
ncbi:PAPA-1 domain-containing protein [Heracleum sosnowskyi]|uniref:PAPA-1 domain-containing protein n=1 Tax=Heracleum sosnowskyi TaxID=360622 RepID=A0AAD8MU04_9APIA|nr:PAPA-1 domain-containing protein [Heracleum sosnowskyi]